MTIDTPHIVPYDDPLRELRRRRAIVVACVLGVLAIVAAMLVFDDSGGSNLADDGAEAGALALTDGPLGAAAGERPVDAHSGEMQGADPRLARDLLGRVIDASKLDSVVVDTGEVPTGSAPLRPAVAEVDLPDPSVLFVGDDAYAFGSTSRGFNVPVASTQDGGTWSEPVEAVPILPAWGVSGVTWSPAVVEVDGTYLMYLAVLQRSGDGHCVGVLSSTKPLGPYQSHSAPVICDLHGSIDPSVGQSAAGLHLYWRRAGATGSQLYGVALTDDGLGTEGEPVAMLNPTEPWEGGSLSNPSILELDGQFHVLYTAGWWHTDQSAVGRAVCAGPLGPCEKVAPEAPWLASDSGVDGPGGASFAIDAIGQPWMALHGWSGGIGYESGGIRSLHLEPLTLEDGVIVIANSAPVGALERVVRAPGGVHATGWAADLDRIGPATVRFLLDGRVVGETEAGIKRADVAKANPGIGGNRGFSAPVEVPPGTYRLCAEVVDDLDGASVEIGCTTIDVAPAPFGLLESVAGANVGGDGQITAVGWALDPDVKEPIQVDLFVDGELTATVTASGARGDIAAQFGGYGTAFGFNEVLSAGPGQHEVCADAKDHADGPAVRIGCLTTVVPATPSAPPPSTSTTTPPTFTFPTFGPPSTTRPPTTTTRPTTTTTVRPTTTTTTSTTTTTTTEPTTTTDTTEPTTTTDTTEPTTTTDTTEPTTTTDTTEPIPP